MRPVRVTIVRLLLVTLAGGCLASRDAPSVPDLRAEDARIDAGTFISADAGAAMDAGPLHVDAGGDAAADDAVTVHDARTGLEWQRFEAPTTHTFASATTYCDELVLEGDGWRLPSIRELATIIDYKHRWPAIDPVAFPGTTISSFVSSSYTSYPELNDLPGPWVVVPWGATLIGQVVRGESYGVRCVRGTADLEPSFSLDDAMVVVTEARTGLVWQRGHSPERHTQTEAHAYCASLSLAGGGWRLPTLVEWQTLIDYTRYRPAMDPAFFPYTYTGGYATATSWDPDPADPWYYPWHIDPFFGFTDTLMSEIEYWVRCVR